MSNQPFDNQTLKKLQEIPILMENCVFNISDKQNPAISNFKYQILTYNLSQEMTDNKKAEYNSKLTEINDFDIKFPNIILCRYKKIQSSQFYFFLFDDKLLIINKIYISQLNSFLSKISSQSNLYFFSNKQKEIFLREISSQGIDSCRNISVFNDLFKFNIKNTLKCNFFELEKFNSKFWRLIEKVVVGFIIKKSCILTSLEREKRKKSLLFHTKDTKYDQKEFLFINNFQNVQMRCNIKEQKMCIFKISSSDNREKKCYDAINCQHPFISNKIGEIDKENEKFIVIEYIEGNNLKMTDISKLKYFEKIKIIGEIMLAIEYIHSKNIIIRDLKLENIIIDSMNDAVMIDFDKSKLIEDKSKLIEDKSKLIEDKSKLIEDESKLIEDESDFTANIGSLAFSAPEQHANNKYTYKIDIYSLAIIIYVIIIGELPVEKSKQIFERIPNNFLFLKEIFEVCLEDSPENRPNISNLLNDYLFKLQDSLNDETIKENQKEIDDIVKYLTKIRFQFLKQINAEDHFEIIDLSAIYYYIGIVLIEGNFIQQNIEESIKYLKYSSKLNNASAHHSLGKLFYNGNYIPKDLNKSIYYLALASNQNKKESQFLLGIIYIPIDIQKAIYYHELAANQNMIFAQKQLAIILLIQKQFNKAIHYFELAANQNDVESQCILGHIFIDGNINQIIYNLRFFLYQYNLPFPPDNESYDLQNIEKGIHYYTLAADQNNNIAQFILGIIYYEGRYVKRDFEKAAKYLIQYQGEEQSKAYFNLGLIYIDEQNPNYDIKKAIHYFDLSSNLGNSGSQYNLGLIYYKYVFDINKSIKYFTLAAKNNHSNAQYNLGLIFSDGIYIKRDINKAIYYLNQSATKNNNQLSQALLGMIYYKDEYGIFKIDDAIHFLTLSANQGNSEAQFHLGNIYYIKKYNKIDLKKSIEYYTKSARQGNSRAQFNLSMLYKNEFNDINNALFYLTEAANKNDKKAQFCLGLTYYDEYNSIFNFNNAFKYLSLSAEKNHPEALFVLGFIYHEGKYITKDISKAFKYYIDSSNLSNFKAKNNLAVIYKNGDINIPRNIYYSIDLFEELIRKTVDCYSLFNLAKIYYFDSEIEKNITKTLNLLNIASSNCFVFADVFLFFIYSCDENIKNEDKANKFLIKINKEMNNKFIFALNDDDVFDGLYFIESIDLIYYPIDNHQSEYMNFFFGIKYKNPTNKKNSKEHNVNQIAINESFYQGFELN